MSSLGRIDSIKTIHSKEIRKSLNLVIIAVAFGMAFTTVQTGPSLTGFIRELGVEDFLYSVIMALPVLGGVTQVFASYILENSGERKRILIVSGLIQRLLWILIGLIPFIIPLEKKSLIVWSIIILFGISSAAGSAVGITFNSWMGDLVPLKIRGRFFSKRTMIYTITGAITTLSAGKFLDLVPGFKGYAILFLIIAILGSIDILFFIWVYDPPMVLPKKKIPLTKLITEPLKNKNYMNFILFACIWSFGVNIAGPFFNVYMLEDLGMSYFMISLTTQFAANISTILLIRYWGHIIDKYGNKPVMNICCALILTLPILWLFVTPQSYLLILPINLFSGILWSGYELVTINLSIWLAPEKNRSIYIASYTLFVSVFGIALAYVCGGLFMSFARPFTAKINLPFITGQKLNGFHLIFIVADIFRAIALIFFFNKFHEENSVSVREILNNFIHNLTQKKQEKRNL
jgi:MFS family permease